MAKIQINNTTMWTKIGADDSTGYNFIDFSHDLDIREAGTDVIRIAGGNTTFTGNVSAKSYVKSSAWSASESSSEHTITLAQMGLETYTSYSASCGILMISWKSNSADVMSTWTGMITYQYPSGGGGAQAKVIYVDEISSQGTWTASPHADGTSVKFTPAFGANGYRWAFTQLGY